MPVPFGTAVGDYTVSTGLAGQWSHFGQGQVAGYGHPEMASVRRDGLPVPTTT